MTDRERHTYFWDLDGTITDPRLGIIGAYQALLSEYGLPVPSEASLRWVIGPPLRECLPQVLGLSSSGDIEEAVVKYRHWYVTQGLMYKDTPYPGIEDLLKALNHSGKRLFVATAKAHSYAKLILEHWSLDGYFECIHGSELDGVRSNKAELLSWMLERYGLKGSEQIVMIGDRRHDVVAGRANGLFTVGVGYGYGTETELKEAGAHQYHPTIGDLSKALLSQR